MEQQYPTVGVNPWAAEGAPSGMNASEEHGRRVWADKWRAAGCHLGLSAGLALVVCAMVFWGWYPMPMHAMVGVGTILLLMLWVDVFLGPLVTLVVFDRRKPRLWLDLALIGLVQLGALGYGVYTVERGRPAFVVWVKDRFEMVAPADLRPADWDAARANAVAHTVWWGPQWVAAVQPTQSAERLQIMLEAAAVGRDIQHHPRLYVEYATQSDQVLQRALPIKRLREMHPDEEARITRAVAKTGQAEASVRYVPIRGRAQDGVVLLDAVSARVLGVALVRPW